MLDSFDGFRVKARVYTCLLLPFVTKNKRLIYTTLLTIHVVKEKIDLVCPCRRHIKADESDTANSAVPDNPSHLQIGIL